MSNASVSKSVDRVALLKPPAVAAGRSVEPCKAEFQARVSNLEVIGHEPSAPIRIESTAPRHGRVYEVWVLGGWLVGSITMIMLASVVIEKYF